MIAAAKVGTILLGATPGLIIQGALASAACGGSGHIHTQIIDKQAAIVGGDGYKCRACNFDYRNGDRHWPQLAIADPQCDSDDPPGQKGKCRDSAKAFVRLRYGTAEAGSFGMPPRSTSGSNARLPPTHQVAG